jgi:hypothetical protein
MHSLTWPPDFWRYVFADGTMAELPIPVVILEDIQSASDIEDRLFVNAPSDTQAAHAKSPKPPDESPARSSVFAYAHPITHTHTHVHTYTHIHTYIHTHTQRSFTRKYQYRTALLHNRMRYVTLPDSLSVSRDFRSVRLWPVRSLPLTR